MPQEGDTAGTGACLKPQTTLTFGRGAGPLGGGPRALSPEPQAQAERGPQPAQLGLRLPPGALGLGPLLLQAAEPLAGPVQASLEAIGCAAGLLQLPGDAEQLGPEGPLGAPALAEALLQLLLPGRGPGFRLHQRVLRPQDLGEGLGAPDPPAL